MKFFELAKAVWTYLNGKKTNIGNLVLLAGLVLGYMNIDVDPEKLEQIVTVLIESGVATTVFGLIHQLIKKFTAKETEG